MRCGTLLLTLLFCVAHSGCVMFEVGVTNPVAGLTTVAVAPFFNLSEEPTVDGRRFAAAYFTELQKTPGFQVVPVGVVEQAIHDHQLQMSSPEDALKLAKILNIDAVVVGAVTDYSPYYPPRIGLQVSWYSPYQWTFNPGVPVHDDAWLLANPKRQRFSFHKAKPMESCEPPVTNVIRGQSEIATPLSPTLVEPPSTWDRLRNFQLPSYKNDASEVIVMTPTSARPFNPQEPLMSYTRMFDGADPQLTARLRDYYELSGDLRSGGWEAYLNRSEDYIRFTSHVMIVEMLQLHGGEAKRRMVVKLRKHR